MGRYFTVHAGENFTARVVDFVHKNIQNDNPLALADVTIWVPAPRIAAALKDAFLKQQSGVILPQIRSFSVGEEDSDLLRFEMEEEQTTSRISPLLKMLKLAQWVHLKEPSLSYSQALEGAATLMQLFSKLSTYHVTLEDFAAHIPTELAVHWEKNLTFLNIVFSAYPDWLAEAGYTDNTLQAQSVMQEQAKQYSEKGMDSLVVAAGFADTTPDGAALLKAIADLENGAVIFPCVDIECTAEQREALGETHPQYRLMQLLKAVDIEVNMLAVLGNAETDRSRVWKKAFNLENCDAALVARGIAGMSVIEAETVQEEAEAIALIMRESLLEEKQTCALITPDRSLAKRVEALLKRWQIDVDDSAGKALHQTEAGMLFLQISEVFLSTFKAMPMAVLASNALCCFGLPAPEWAKKSTALQHFVLRGVESEGGLHGLSQKLQLMKQDPFQKQHYAEDAEAALVLFKDSFKPFFDLKGKQKLTKWVGAHLEIMRLLMQKDDVEQNPLEVLLKKEDGESLFTLLQSWQEASITEEALSFQDYTAALTAFMAKTTVRKKYHMHPRLFIWGSPEARLQSVDRVIIAALNEGKWPRKAKADPWLNQAAAIKLGLPSLESMVSLNAHDFLSLACIPQVYFTRSKQDRDGEAIPSRYLTKLKASIGDDAWQSLCARSAGWLHQVRQLRVQGGCEVDGYDRAFVDEKHLSTLWSASYIEKLMGCPYQAYVNKTLRLKALADFDEEYSYADKGQLIHTCLEAFFTPIKGLPTPYSGAVDAELMETHLLDIGKVAFKPLEKTVAGYLWWEKYVQIAKGFAQKLVEGDVAGRRVFAVEKEGRCDINHGVTLHARADRIDKMAEGLVILDYKTGNPPAKSKVRSGIKPQMAVEAVLAHKGGYGGGETLAQLEYWHVSGKVGQEIAVTSILDAKNTAIEFTEKAQEGLNKLAAYFVKEKSPYDIVPGEVEGLSRTGICTYCDFAGVCRFQDKHKQGDV